MIPFSEESNNDRNGSNKKVCEDCESTRDTRKCSYQEISKLGKYNLNQGFSIWGTCTPVVHLYS